MSGGEGDGSDGGAGVRRFVLALGDGVRAFAGWKIALFVAAAIVPLLLFAGMFVAASSSALGGEGASCSVQGKGGEIPPEYLPWLEAAANEYKLGPRGFAVVAAIHKVESDFGRSPLPGIQSGANYAGAAGPGQFLAGTWAIYGVDADRDGWRDVYSVPDSVFATANYLHASGAPQDWRAAIFAYNHAEWYVEEVLQVAAGFAAAEVCLPVASPLGQLPTDPLRRIEYVARWIEARRVHYCWGGGHAAKPGPSPGPYCWSAAGRQVFGAREDGLDCSGAVRWLLVLSGYPDPGPLRSDQLGAAYSPGPGRHVTIWSNVDHVFVTIDGRAWGTASSHFAHGPAFGPQSHAGFAPSHLPGL